MCINITMYVCVCVYIFHIINFYQQFYAYQTEEDVFMVSLICNIDADCEKLLVCKLDLDCVKVLHFDIEVSLIYISLCLFVYFLLFPGSCKVRWFNSTSYFVLLSQRKPIIYIFILHFMICRKIMTTVNHSLENLCQPLAQAMATSVENHLFLY